MDETAFLTDFADVLEVPLDSIETSMRLDELGAWDSLAVVRFLAFAQTQYGVKVAPASLRSCGTIRDLMGLVG